MSWLGALSGRWSRKSTSAGTWEVFRRFFADAGRSRSGVNVTLSNALEVSTVLACARVIADGLAQVPLKVFREQEGSRLPAREHPLYRVLHRKPNEWQTSFEYRQTIGLHLVLAGNHYSYKNVVRGQVAELVPLPPQSCRAILSGKGYELRYQVTMPDGVQTELPASSIWHIRGPSWCGWLGLEAVKLAREAIGLAIATESQHARLFTNGISASGVYSVDGTLSETQYAQLRKFLADNYSGEKAGLPMILDRNAKWQPLARTGVEAQHIETRRFQVQEICRALRVMPIMVGLDDKASTYASAEQMFLAHAVHTLGPWYECLEQSMDVNLLSEADQERGYYCKHVVQGLMRGSMKDRAEYLAKGLGAGGAPGWLTQDDAREWEELNPFGGAAAKLPVITNAPPPPQDTPAAKQAFTALVELKSRVDTLSTLAAAGAARVPEVHVKAGDVSVQMPAQAAPVVNTEVKVPPTEVKVDVAAPEVKVDVQPPVVNVAAPEVKVDVAAPNVTLPDVMQMQITEMPTRVTTSSLERDGDGQIVRTTQTEKDA